MIAAMAEDSETSERSEEPTEEKPKRSLRQRIHDRLVAAEVAAEESAGYGFAVEAVEAVETAVDPEHELGSDENGEDGTQAKPPSEVPEPEKPA